MPILPAPSREVDMRKFAIAGVAALAIAATTAVYAQHSWFHDRMMGHTRMSPEDRAAMASAATPAIANFLISTSLGGVAVLQFQHSQKVPTEKEMRMLVIGPLLGG